MSEIHPDAAVFACDANHLPQALVAARRVAEVEPRRRFDICICTPTPEAMPALRPSEAIRVVKIDVTRVPNYQHPKPWISIGTFYRHLLPEFFATSYRAILYMDTDTLVRRAGIQGLFERMGNDFPIAAVRDFVHVRASRKSRLRRSRLLLADLGGSGGEYYQAGVLLINVARHVAEGMGEQVLHFAETQTQLLQRHKLGDQAALNGACADRIVPLSPLWNWHSATWLRAGLVARFDPYVLHFIGSNKPWTVQEDPYVEGFNEAYFKAMREIEPGWQPTVREGSLPWYDLHPRYRNALANRIHHLIRSHRIRQKYSDDPAFEKEAAERMQELIDAAVVG